jgi:hypothetical protein
LRRSNRFPVAAARTDSRVDSPRDPPIGSAEETMSHRMASLFALMFTFSCDGEVTHEKACSDYCDKRAECDDEVEVDDCNDTCNDIMEECDDDAETDAIEDLDQCAEESCDDVASCGFDQGVDCIFQF